MSSFSLHPPLPSNGLLKLKSVGGDSGGDEGNVGNRVLLFKFDAGNVAIIRGFKFGFNLFLGGGGKNFWSLSNTMILQTVNVIFTRERVWLPEQAKKDAPHKTIPAIPYER